jgi:transcription-repair coupling factor (superfamily II helicase)
MQDMAGELLKLYAERTTAQGTAFSKDNEFQREFEDSFDYSETDDQLSAIRAIKYDMESTDADGSAAVRRCGLRQDRSGHARGLQGRAGRQAGGRADADHDSELSAFRDLQEAVCAVSHQRGDDLALPHGEGAKDHCRARGDGKVDILIGTHRLLSKDIKFQDLGLLVVDEEQRFGVRHKERLKQMRKEIDVLAMSATPIPRTLHMSLVGLRDMSVIETPPKDRMAIQTVVAKFDEKIIRSAVEVELERGGQVYFVHNRVESIYEIAARIQELVPGGARCVGHGQMSETELERVMLAFMRHEYDVLVATTIIENGLDIPLANTMLINRADRHGLSELYQLRGRVGRSNRRAYAYLLIPPEQELTEIARRRLAALKEFSDLGAGFKIAALDLELRGAGNMLGGEQSGHIEAVGFELYTSMLEAAVKEMKGESERGAAGDAAQPGHCAAHRRELCAGGESAAAALQEDRRSGERGGGRRGARGDGRPLRRAARCDGVPAGGGADAAGMRADRHCAGGSQARRLQIRFMENAAVDPQHLMRLVARNAKRGAQFTPQGLLKYPLAATRSDEVLLEIHELLANLAPAPVNV